VRFLRHLAAVALLVAVVVAGGLAWGHFDGGTLAGPGQGGITRLGVTGGPAAAPGQKVKLVLPPGARPGSRVPPGTRVVIQNGSFNLGLDSMFQAVNLPVLRDTVEIEAGVIAAVVILEIGHRRWRRAWRARRLAAVTRPPR
jgi:hypothetical protein